MKRNRGKYGPWKRAWPIFWVKCLYCKHEFWLERGLKRKDYWWFTTTDYCCASCAYERKLGYERKLL